MSWAVRAAQPSPAQRGGDGCGAEGMGSRGEERRRAGGGAGGLLGRSRRRQRRPGMGPPGGRGSTTARGNLQVRDGRREGNAAFGSRA